MNEIQRRELNIHLKISLRSYKSGAGDHKKINYNTQIID